MSFQPHLAHSLKARHILMIALGSAIGTGFFFGAGESIKLAGPSILLSFIIGGLIMYIVIRALGEMAVYEPNVGSFSFYAYKYVGNYAGFISGWNYWFNYIIVSMIELTAIAMFLDYWFPNISHWVAVLIFFLVFVAINLSAVKLFGEFEFWFAGIKVLTILALIIFGLYLIFFDNSIRNSSTTNIKNLWQLGGFFANGIHGFLFSFIMVIFSFGGTELIGIVAGEAKNPIKIIPIAINGIIVRILIFYIATLTIIMCLYPWNQISNSISPFVDVFQKIGIPKAASLMNFVAITAALSSFNTGIYGTARMAFNLGMQKNAPSYLTKINKLGVPYNAIFFSSIFILVTVILNYLYPKQLFGILVAIAVVSAIINWVIILLTHICFRYKTDKTKLLYKLPFYPFTSIIAITFFLGIIIIMSQMESRKLAIYISPIWLVILSIFYFIKLKTSKNMENIIDKSSLGSVKK